MFVFRNAVLEDAPQLLELASTVRSSNLPPDPQAMEDRIAHAAACFGGAAVDDSAVYMFVVEDSASREVVGTSSLVTGKGTPERPRLFLRVRTREHYSRDLNAGQLQMTVQLRQDCSGPTEIGGLVLAEQWRGGPHRLGSLLSKMRFAYIGMHPDRFSNRLIGEIMGTLTQHGRTTLWDHLGRRFINLSYVEADAFSRTSKEFILSLFPKDEIYVSLLPPEARRLIGRASPEAVPAMRMLERQGFRRCDEVDPFDGGPYIEAERDQVPLVRATTSRVVTGIGGCESAAVMLLGVDSDGGFRGVRDQAALEGDEGVVLGRDAADALRVEVGDDVGVTPMTGSGT
ncbi:MAG: arginine N-succinyltransferase [Phycisphaerales bacterium]|nr:arginine N-succinyltransferase [Phycisphaerales bacterium]